MAPSTCCFCAHLNPARAKFCNECASPLHLKPCRLCDAVNARDAQACYRCGAALPAAATTPEASPERIVAQADETLAALKRELVATTAPGADISRESIRDNVGEDIANASATFDVGTSDPAPSAAEGVAGDRATPALDTTAEHAAPATAVSQPHVPIATPILEEEIARENRLQSVPGVDSEEAMDATPPAAARPEPTFDPTSIAVRPEDREWRPERRSRGSALAMAVALVVALPIGVYVTRNPAQMDEWLGRTPAPSTVEPATADAMPAAAPVVVPTEPRATSPATSSDPAAVRSDAATGAQAAPQRAARDETLLPPSPPADLAAQGDSDSVVVTPERKTKAAPTARARSPAPGARPRERATRPRAEAPADPLQVTTARSAIGNEALPTQPCSEGVTALGLCSR